MKAFLLTLVISLPATASVPFYLQNEWAMFLFSQQKYQQAQATWTGLLGEPQGTDLVHFNLGGVWWQLKNFEQALAAWQIADRTSTEFAVQFSARFNQGAAQQLMDPKKPKVREALAAYQQALAVNPESYETKVNIELLIQQAGSQSQSESGDQGESEQQQEQGQQQKKFANPQPQKQPFKSEELSQADVNKILNELKRQEQKIRGEYQQKEQKEVPRGKDW